MTVTSFRPKPFVSPDNHSSLQPTLNSPIRATQYGASEEDTFSRMAKLRVFSQVPANSRQSALRFGHQTHEKTEEPHRHSDHAHSDAHSHAAISAASEKPHVHGPSCSHHHHHHDDHAHVHQKTTAPASILSGSAAVPSNPVSFVFWFIQNLWEDKGMLLGHPSKLAPAGHEHHDHGHTHAPGEVCDHDHHSTAPAKPKTLWNRIKHLGTDVATWWRELWRVFKADVKILFSTDSPPPHTH